MSYQRISENASAVIRKNKNTANQISYLRLLLAILGLYLLYNIIKNGSTTPMVVATVLVLAVFLVLVNYHQKIIEKIQYYETLYRICEKEILATEGVHEQFDGGDEYLDKTHFFSFDLDIFGNHSIFQLLNRSITQAGKDTLANQVQFPVLEKNTIVARQKAIEELSNKIDWRVNFLATGNLLEKDETKYQELIRWLKTPEVDLLKNLKVLLWLVPAVNAILLGAWVFGFISFRVWLLTLILQSVFSFVNQKKFSLLYLQISKNASNIQKYSQLFQLIEKEEFTASTLQNWRTTLVKPFQVSALIQKLATIAAYFAVRNNFFGPILNALFLWDFQCARQFEIWKKQYSANMLEAFTILHEWEALVSIACYDYAHANYAVPEFSEHIVLDATQMGHPLLKKGKSVNNDFRINEGEQIFIVTGANMAGKSTFLRATGANLILAMAGARVRADKFICKPIQVYTCMRITDSINEGESYFHAELLRIQKIITLLDEGKEIFVILDELLKGTNSRDKLQGSELFLAKLVQYKTAFGMIATHDLDLTAMAGQYPEKIKNICFEIIIDNDKMTFDYKLRAGVTQNMNALFLMKQMGIV
ncbi:MutS-related protein [Emticicia sp. 17c]|uniref:MutS-related protein n=1 Tax=Emticicia sp. 17c TaxID=3127704 RepID=UPI00301BF453